MSDAIDHDAAQALFDVTVVGVAIVRPDDVMERVNAKFAAVLGYSPRELEGTTWESITHRPDIEADAAMVRDVIEGRIQGYPLFKRYLHKDGRLVPMNLQVNAVRGPDGSPRLLLAQIYAPAPQVAGDPVAAEKMRAEARRAMLQIALGVLCGISFAGIGAFTQSEALLWAGGAIALVAIGGAQALDKWRTLRGGT